MGSGLGESMEGVGRILHRLERGVRVALRTTVGLELFLQGLTKAPLLESSIKIWSSLILLVTRFNKCAGMCSDVQTVEIFAVAKKFRSIGVIFRKLKNTIHSVFSHSKSFDDPKTQKKPIARPISAPN